MTENKDKKNSKPRASRVKEKGKEEDKDQKKNAEQSKEQKQKQKPEQDQTQGQTQDQKKEQEQKQEQEKKRHSALDDFGNQVEKIAVKTAESIRKVVDKALASRNTVLTIRVNDECNRKMNMLVDAGLFKSRSESAAFLIHEGIKNQEVLFCKISTKLDKIEKIREELKKVVSEEFSPEETAKK
jgi:Arc/MetJ-type ribon-helix-helix transcriptional regulator